MAKPERTKEEVIEEMQKVVEQMRLDDIEDNPESANEYFQCDACGQDAPLAGSIQYNNYRLCNDCVLLAEVGFELGQLKNIEELIDKMDDKRLEADCEFLKREQQRMDN
ncbi:MAG: hypothetical protein K6E29_05670 [Cyanobacteria bacterium RUI128]|nr:hypothetical protein [Cyanobacteria bacterium RUI128]